MFIIRTDQVISSASKPSSLINDLVEWFRSSVGRMPFYVQDNTKPIIQNQEAKFFYAQNDANSTMSSIPVIENPFIAYFITV